MRKLTHNQKRAKKAKARRKMIAQIVHGKPEVVARYLKSKI